MKSLTLSLLLFFLIGTHGNSIAQETDPEPPTPGAQESLKNLIHGAFVLGAELVGIIDSPDSEKISHLQKRGESLFSDVYNMFFALGVTFVDTYKEVDEEIHKEYPTYRTKVIPIVEDYVSKILKYVLSLKDEILPYATKANLEIMKIHLQFISDIKSVFEGHIDQLQSFKEDMHAKIKPFVEQVQQEVKAREKEESGDKHLNDAQREVYKSLIKGMATDPNEEPNRTFKLLEMFTNKA